ncbi:synaptosomal-associated protein 47 isoform X2 [Nerophis lumbriciformis]|uniref:synaptosomal-associated protein 47 isoform X2 n=1 Tax=Nerophis lumbriciformis TaxID=546530 RepID=UPI003BACB13B
MSRGVFIHSWPGSYYINSDKRWENGTLSLSRTTLCFISNQTKENLASFSLSRIMEIKMESSSFIFSTLTVLEEGNAKHWFGSLKPNRVVVYNVLEHFWRERLLSPGSEAKGQPENRTSKGRDLISLVAGDQRRLEDTGTVLSHQGEQFDHMIQGLEKIDSDLGVADKLLSQLESTSWWPFGKIPWKIQQEAKAEDAALAAAAAYRGPDRSKVIASIPAVVSKGRDCDLKPGCLLVLVSSLEVRNTGCQLLHCFQRNEIDEIQVHSPCRRRCPCWRCSTRRRWSSPVNTLPLRFLLLHLRVSLRGPFPVMVCRTGARTRISRWRSQQEGCPSCTCKYSSRLSARPKPKSSNRC